LSQIFRTDARTFIAALAFARPLGSRQPATGNRSELFYDPRPGGIVRHQNDSHAITDQHSHKIPPHRIREVRGHLMPAVQLHSHELAGQQFHDPPFGHSFARRQVVRRFTPRLRSPFDFARDDPELIEGSG
jgi:hypothetical protein